jgi:hypothetical protein
MTYSTGRQAEWVGIMAMGLIAVACWAHDLVPPCWRNQAGSTFQQWTFNTGANPANPDLAANPYGVAQAQVAVGPFGAGWLWDLRFGTNRGYWDLGRHGTVTLSIPNDPTAPGGAWKYVWVQMTYWDDPPLFVAPAVSVPGATLLATTNLVVEQTFLGQWSLQQTLWRLDSSPNAETVTLTAAANGGVVDQVVVDTKWIKIDCPADLVLEADPGQCSKANVTYVALPEVDGCIVTNVSCSPPNGSTFPVGTTPVSCIIWDGGGKTVNCSFSVTVTDTLGPYVCATQPQAVVQGGPDDDFTGPEPGTPSAALLSILGEVDLRGYDEGCELAFFATTLRNLPTQITEAHLRLRLRACGTFSHNDMIFLGFVDASGRIRPERWSRRLGFLGSPGLLDTPWTNGRVHEFVLDLAQLPNASGPPTDLLGALNAMRQLDIVVHEDTQVDYVALEMTANACGPGAAVCGPDVETTAEPDGCGAIVNYALPHFIDPCDGSNVMVMCDPPPGAFFGVGRTEVHCTAFDPHGNPGSCSFAVTVHPHPGSAPRLSIGTEQVGTETVVVIYWPVSCVTTWQLEETDALWPWTVWRPVVEPPVNENGLWVVRMRAKPGQSFYRLRSD